jgi:hypothetical protein
MIYARLPGAKFGLQFPDALSKREVERYLSLTMGMNEEKVRDFLHDSPGIMEHMQVSLNPWREFINRLYPMSNALIDASSMPENLYYPFHITDCGNMLYQVTWIYTHEQVCNPIPWSQAKSMVLTLNNGRSGALPPNAEDEHAMGIPAKSQPSLSLYMIRRRRVLRGQSAKLVGHEEKKLLARVDALDECMDLYCAIVQEKLPLWENQDKSREQLIREWAYTLWDDVFNLLVRRMSNSTLLKEEEVDEINTFLSEFSAEEERRS